MVQANADIRKKAMMEGVRMWQIAHALGINESTLTRWLRKELPEEVKSEIFRAIGEISRED